MNRADVIAAAIEQAIPSLGLLLFADFSVSDTSEEQRASVLSTYVSPGTSIVTATLQADGNGISIARLGAPLGPRVTWDDLAGCLSAVITEQHVVDLVAAYQDSLRDDHRRARGERRLVEIRGELAHAATATFDRRPPAVSADATSRRRPPSAGGRSL